MQVTAWSLCAPLLPCQREVFLPGILAEPVPGSISGARVQWLAGQKGSRPHGTDLVVGKTGSSLSGPRSGPAACRWCGQAHLNVRSEEPATGAQCADPRGCHLVHRGSPAGGRRVQGHTWSGGRGGCGWQARRAQEGATAEEPWSQGGERQVWSGELVQHPSPVPPLPPPPTP